MIGKPRKKGLVYVVSAAIILIFIQLYSVTQILYATETTTSMPANSLSAHLDPQAADIFLQLLTGTQVAASLNEYNKPFQKTVYLTFDDGPSHLTSEVLDLLNKEDIQATFFMLGQQAQRRPELVQRVVREGHALGNHTYNHDYEGLYTDFDEFWRQIHKTEEVFEKITGVTPALIRAPGGTHRHFDAFYFYYLEQAGYEIHDWNIDSGDSKRIGVPKAEIIETIKKGPFPHEINLLLHDGPGHEESIKALPEIIKLFRDKGYRFAPLTTEVEPVHHSIGNPKWEKSYSARAHARWIETTGSKRSQMMDTFTTKDLAFSIDQAEIDQTGLSTLRPHLLAERFSTDSMDLAMAEPTKEAVKKIDVPKQPLPLNITYEHKAISLKEHDYQFRNQRFYVPLRKWQEQQGNKVSWDAASGTATVEYGESDGSARIIEIDTKQQITYSNAKHGGSVDLFIERGTLYISLRDMIELDQYEVSDYILTLKQREVFVQHRV